MRKPDLDSLLQAWEENYKKGLLIFWLLLLLHERESDAFEMSRTVAEASRQKIRADENSIDRGLNRFENLGLVASSWRASDLGPPHRSYRLAETARALQQAFIRRNVLLQEEAVASRIQAALDGAAGPEDSPSEEIPSRRRQRLRQALPFVYGVVFALLVIVVFGDLRHFNITSSMGCRSSGSCRRSQAFRSASGACSGTPGIPSFSSNAAALPWPAWSVPSSTSSPWH